ncbi:tyrosine-type recombinase/integrase [Altererythrobacter aurantiacus]|uniref:Tyrosine-type recombinase/integrase n=1 Tax=Parapontixanthobacter aurantiacus TaxID=1463599 RepID=A0A844ZG49_9SPHN|nr:site-specific integrase [Parapontixanthobacter aurantiacus]MXO86524.1 tyrosine-type recombinase/integrase [Parapontixanthobacter aurantiacus]
MPKLTKTQVEKVMAPSQSPLYLWDDRIAGFGLKVLPSGKRKYVFKYRFGHGPNRIQKWMQLGSHGVLSTDDARRLAQQATACLARGVDPRAANGKSEQPPSLSEAWDRFASDYLPQKKSTTKRDYQAAWETLIKPRLGTSLVDEITTDDVEKLHKSLSQTPYRANRTLALLSRIFNLAERWGWRSSGTNPCKAVEKFKEIARQRFLSKEELGRLYASLNELQSRQLISVSAANAIQLLLHTGARSREITTAEWSWLSEERKTLALPDSKSGAKLIYLSEAALEICRSQRKSTGKTRFMFPGSDLDKPIVNLRKPWLRVCEHARLDGVRIHDLRHTAASIAIGAGASLTIVGKLLGHTQAQTTLRYAHLEADPALVAANLLGAAIESSSGKV